MDSTPFDEKAKNAWTLLLFPKVYVIDMMNETGKTYVKQGKKFCKNFDRKVLI